MVFLDSRVWLTWERHTRSRSLSDRLDATLVEIDISDRSRLIRYAVSFWKSRTALKSLQPSVLFVQNPSLVLAVFGCLYAKQKGIPIVVDAHNAGIFPAEGRNKLLAYVSSWIIRRAMLTIVTTESFVEVVESRGGSAIAVPDPLPVLPVSERPSPVSARARVFFVCTWAADEPYLEVINAADQLSEEADFFVSGKLKDDINLPEVSDNVTLCGFLSDTDFYKQMHDADIVVDLTNREDCLVCGAYEAVSLGRPLLLSDTVALRNYFSKGTRFTDNSASDIAIKIRGMMKDRSILESEVKQLRTDLRVSWATTLTRLEAKIVSLSVKTNSTA